MGRRKFEFEVGDKVVLLRDYWWGNEGQVARVIATDYSEDNTLEDVQLNINEHEWDRLSDGLWVNSRMIDLADGEEQL